jgi:hypothetical protein
LSKLSQSNKPNKPINLFNYQTYQLSAKLILIDAHVHIYDCFDLENFFDSAYANFKTAAEQLNHGNDFTGILLLAETAKENWFQRLTEYADGKNLPEDKDTANWIFRRTDEIFSLHPENGDTKNLILIAGWQIVTEEELEVLALATTERFKDGIPIKQLIEYIKDRGGIPVIPWGFGKWMGRRGTHLNRMLEAAQDSDFYLGDNANRLFFMPAPYQFKLAQNKTIPNLPGSDPLPFVSEGGRAGSFGTIVPKELSKEKPADYLKGILKKPGNTFQYYGELERPYRFFRNQIASQLKKRLQG